MYVTLAIILSAYRSKRNIECLIVEEKIIAVNEYLKYSRT